VSILNAITFDTKRITNEGLRRLNLLVSALYGVQALAVLFLSDSTKGSEPITTGYLANDTLASDSTGQTALIHASRHLFDLNLAHILLVVFIMGAIFHLLSATRWRKEYEKAVRNGINSLRWTEYALMTSIIFVAIGLLVGINDLSLLLSGAGATVVMAVLGYALEISKQSSKNAKGFNFWPGVLAGSLPWVFIVVYLIGALIFGSGLPAYVYFIIASVVLLFCGFVIMKYLQYKKLGRWSDNMYSERTYIVISFIAKTLLAWQIFAGALRS
jgi:Heliorhodopsin